MPLYFLKYAVVGGVSTIIHYSFLIIFVEIAGIPAPYSAGLGALNGAIVAYIGNRRFTFHSQNSHVIGLPRFLFVAALGAIFNGSGVWISTQYFETHYLIAQVLATGLVLILTYHINQKWTFQS